MVFKNRRIKADGTGSGYGGRAKTRSLELSKNLQAPENQPVANSSSPLMRTLLGQQLP